MQISGESLPISLGTQKQLLSNQRLYPKSSFNSDPC